MARQPAMNRSSSSTPPFRPCSSCPNPAKCRAAGKCAKKSAPKGKK